MILNKAKEMLEDADAEIILEEQAKIVSTNITNLLTPVKKSVKILLIVNNNDVNRYNEETIAKILAK
jgi:hypothetical protein